MGTQLTTRHSRWSASRCSAFSLLELVIVVVIIGILAAIVIPRVSNAGERSRQSALGANITALQSAVDRYSAEHQGLYPSQQADGSEDTDSANFILRLTQKTDVNGTVSATGIFGPYLKEIPNNPYSGTHDVQLNGLVSGGGDYGFDTRTGKITSDSFTAVGSGNDDLSGSGMTLPN